MNYLIAGGSGLIGRALTAELLGQGHQVCLVSRHPQTLTGLAPGVKAVSWDPPALAAAAAEAQVVVNLAGASIAGNNPLALRWTKRRKREILGSRLGAGEKLTAAVTQAEPKPDLLIQASAIGFYGNTGPGPVTENGQPGNDFLAKVCLDWEASTSGLENLGLRRVVARIGLVFSPRGGLLELLKLPFNFFIGGPIGSGQQFLSWIHIQDLARGLIHLSQDADSRGVYNLTAPNPITNQDFARSLAEVLRKPAWFRVPAFVLKAALGEAATLALDGREVVPRRLLESGFSFQYSQLEEALGDLVLAEGH